MNDLVTIDSEYVQRDFAACYLRVQDGEAAFIETNTAHAAPLLLAALEQAGLRPEAVRYVIVTHVHLDHAGGASALMKACPRATLLAHPRAARHLVDPSKLVASATAVYGAERFASLYGTIDPIDPERVRSLEDGEAVDLGSAQLHFLHTRGHANHHFVVHDPARDTVFTGDTFGLAYPRLQRSGRFVFPSTSPTDFDAAAARESVERVLGLGTSTACLTHFGAIDGLAEAADQLRWWLDRSEGLVELASRLAPDEAEPRVRAGVYAAMAEAATARGLALDLDDRALVEMDLELNAQGLSWAASKLRSA